MSEKELLSVRGLSIGFDMYRKGTKKEVLQVITDLHVTVNRGEIVAIVGSSDPERVFWQMPFSDCHRRTQ